MSELNIYSFIYPIHIVNWYSSNSFLPTLTEKLDLALRLISFSLRLVFSLYGEMTKLWKTDLPKLVNERIKASLTKPMCLPSPTECTRVQYQGALLIDNLGYNGQRIWNGGSRDCRFLSTNVDQNPLYTMLTDSESVYSSAWQYALSQSLPKAALVVLHLRLAGKFFREEVILKYTHLS